METQKLILIGLISALAACASPNTNQAKKSGADKPIFVIDGSTPERGERTGYIPIQDTLGSKAAFSIDKRLSEVLDPSSESRSVLLWEFSLAWVSPLMSESDTTLRVSQMLAGMPGVLIADSIMRANTNAPGDFFLCHVKAKYKAQWFEVTQNTPACPDQKYCTTSAFQAFNPAGEKPAISAVANKCFDDVVSKVREIRSTTVANK